MKFILFVCILFSFSQLQAQPAAQKAYNNGIALFKDQKVKESLAELEKAIKLKPNFYQAYCQLGYFYLLLNNSVPARQNLEKAYLLNKKYGPTQYAIGLLYKNQSSRSDSSLVWFKQARKIGIDTSAEMKYNVAWAYNANKQYDSAISLLKEALLLNNKAKTFYKEIAYAYVMGKKLNEGISFFESQIILDLDVIYYNIAMMALEIGDREKANKHIDTLKGINPKLASIVERRRDSGKKILQE